MGDGCFNNFMKKLLKQLTCRKSHGIGILDLCNGQHGQAVRLGEAVRVTDLCGSWKTIAAFTPYGMEDNLRGGNTGAGKAPCARGYLLAGSMAFFMFA